MCFGEGNPKVPYLSHHTQGRHINMIYTDIDHLVEVALLGFFIEKLLFFPKLCYFLETKYLHTLFGIFLQGRSFSFYICKYVYMYLFTYWYQYELMDTYFIFMDIIHCFMSTSLSLGSVRHFRLILSIYYLSLRISHFSKESWLLLLENGIGKQGLGARCAHSCRVFLILVISADSKEVCVCITYSCCNTSSPAF